MSAPRPNLFVIGASKCGTTFVHDLLAQHPDIFMSRIKEPSFFNRPDQQEHLAEYLSLFSEGAGHLLRGESSPVYCETLAFPSIPEDIHRFSPDAKIIYLVREPFSRFKSVWVQTLSTGHWAEKKFFPMKMPRSYREAVFTYPTFLDTCRYWTNLNNYRAHFSDRNIKVILFEQMVTDIEGTLRDVFAFLDVDPDAGINPDAAKQNSGAEKRIYQPWGKRFGHLVPDPVKGLLPQGLRLRLRATVNRLPAPKFDHTDLSAGDVAEIRRQLAPEVRALYGYMGIKDDPWHFLGMGDEGKPSTAASRARPV